MKRPFFRATQKRKNSASVSDVLNVSVTFRTSETKKKKNRNKENDNSNEDRRQFRVTLDSW